MNISYLNILIFFGILTLILGFIIFIIVSYFVIKFLKLGIDDNIIFFYGYNARSQDILNIYGDCIIDKVYLIKQPFGKILTYFLNILTFYNYKKCIIDLGEKYLYHTAFVFKLVMKDGTIKFILIEKNNCINISDNFKMSSNHEAKTIRVKKIYTLNKILCRTHKRIGNNRFFNWSIYKNNCVEFSKEILTTLKKLNEENKQFVSCDRVIDKLNLSEFTVHIINCLTTAYTILEKYVSLW